MCRLLCVNLKTPDDVRQYIENFALKCRVSKEYQGDGFGISYLNKSGEFETKKSLKPIWAASELIQSIPYTTFVLVHARSAFGEATIGDIECNQPFVYDKFLFAFNGNLQKVSLTSLGKIGALKIFNILKLKEFDILSEAIAAICQKAAYVKAFNLIAIKNKDIYVHNQVGSKEDKVYFNMWVSERPNKIIISSEKLDFVDFVSLESKNNISLTRLDV